MSSLVRFTESANGGKRAQRNALTYLIDPQHVGVVVDHSSYTSLLVDGYWLHVQHTLVDVLNKLGRDVSSW